MPDAVLYPEDLLLARKCLEADPAAMERFIENYREPLLRFVIRTGTSRADARRLIGELWVECLAERPTRPPRLTSYAGTVPLPSWLKAIFLNIVLKFRRPGNPRRPDAPLLAIMGEALAAAWREFPEDFVLLQMAHVHGLTARELARLFSCSEAKINRSSGEALQRIAAALRREIHARDPWLDLPWEDFVELCRVVDLASFGPSN